MYGCSKDCLNLIPFRLPQISCFTLSLKCFSSDSDNCPSVGIGHLPQFRHPLRAGPVLLTFLFFPLVPLFYQVLHGSIVLPSALSWCSACTSVSEGIFLMYPWRDTWIHIHLLLHHLVLSTGLFLSFSLVKKILHHVPLHSCIHTPLCVYSDTHKKEDFLCIIYKF